MCYFPLLCRSMCASPPWTLSWSLPSSPTQQANSSSTRYETHMLSAWFIFSSVVRTIQKWQECKIYICHRAGGESQNSTSHLVFQRDLCGRGEESHCLLFPILMKSNTESECVCVPVGAGPGLGRYWFCAKMTHKVLIVWTGGSQETVDVSAGWMVWVCVWMCDWEVKGQLSALFHVRLEGLLRLWWRRGGRRHERENLCFQFFYSLLLFWFCSAL